MSLGRRTANSRLLRRKLAAVAVIGIVSVCGAGYVQAMGFGFGGMRMGGFHPAGVGGFRPVGTFRSPRSLNANSPASRNFGSRDGGVWNASVRGSGPRERGTRYSGGDRGGRDPGGRDPERGGPGRIIPGVGVITAVPPLVGPSNPGLGPPPGGVANSPGVTGGAAGRGGVPPAGERRYVSDEVIAEFAGTPSNQAFAAIAARYRLTRLDTRHVALTDSTWVRWRIAGRRSVPAVVGTMLADGSIRSVQPNYLFTLAEADAQKSENTPAQAKPAEEADANANGDAAQYALAKLHLPEAQALARGDRVLVAVVDTEIDRTNAELAGRIADSFDALGVATPMEAHGTSIAGIIAAHSRLMGAAPGVRLLAVRAFGGGRGTTFAILKGVDWAVARGAAVINMSFAGPADPALARVIAAAHAKGRIVVAAVGNKGPNSPPLYPAADPNAIAVTATDANDRLFPLANRGDYVAVAAPGVDILVAAPDNTYRFSSGTSFAAAYASAVAALLVEREPGLAPDAAKRILMSTAHGLDPAGRSAGFGAGLMDASQAVLAVGSQPSAQLPGPAAR
jgi:hypothetical protein